MKTPPLVFVLALPLSLVRADPGGPDEPVRMAPAEVDLARRDGGLRPAVGVETIQVLRANRDHPELAEGRGWTYNHESMLAFWNGKFHYEFLSNPFGENESPGRTLVMTSADGRSWGFPVEVFPVVTFKAGSVSTVETGMTTMHQDMGFYVAPNGRLLVSGFYQHGSVPGAQGGIGRVVREAYKDGTYGPIYYVRYSVTAKVTEASAPAFSFYTHSPDAGFVEACDALLADKLKTMAWWGEDLGRDGFFVVMGHDTASVFHRKDGTAVVFWRDGWTAISSDEGKTWSKPVKASGVVTDGAKTWGQRTKDGRYAMVYDPVTDSNHRWPIAVATSDDGISFDNLMLLTGEVAPRRYFGRGKDFGIMYMQGICEGNGDPPGTDLWVAFENDKEDLWINRVPVPVHCKVEGPVNDNFDNVIPGAPVPDWNIRRGKWTPVGVVTLPGARHHALQLEDRDPYDYATAMRVFAESKNVRIAFKALARQSNTGKLDIEVMDRHGRRPVQIAFGDDGHIRVMDGAKPVDAGAFKVGSWYGFAIDVNAADGKYDLTLDGKAVIGQAAFAEPAESVERLTFRTGDILEEPTRKSDRYADPRDLPNSGEPVPNAVYDISEVSIR